MFNFFHIVGLIASICDLSPNVGDFQKFSMQPSALAAHFWLQSNPSTNNCSPSLTDWRRFANDCHVIYKHGLRKSVCGYHLWLVSLPLGIRLSWLPTGCILVIFKHKSKVAVLKQLRHYLWRNVWIYISDLWGSCWTFFVWTTTDLRFSPVYHSQLLY